jgi:PAS domain S-box-containing protein
MNFKSINQRLVVWFCLISLIPIMLIAYALLYTFEHELRQAVREKIAVIADKKVDQIEEFLSKLERDVLNRAQEANSRAVMDQFVQVVAHSGIDSAAYRQLDRYYRDAFSNIISNAAYDDLFLISPQGTVVYSHRHKSDFATNLNTGPYRHTGLARVARNALVTLESSFSDFDRYAPSGNAIAAFIAVPVMSEDRIAGVLAVQIEKSRLDEALLDNTGMGITGETVVARRQDELTALVMAPLRDEPNAALQRQILLGNKNRAEPLLRALKGERGSNFEIDYNGQAVVAAWRYLPRMGWSMVVKTDEAEVLAPLYKVRRYAIAGVLLTLIVSLFGAMLFGRRVARPLKEMSKAAQALAVGNLEQRVIAGGQDELGQLARAFNEMADRVQTTQNQLELQVASRTEQLTLSLAQLRESATQLNEAQRLSKVGSWELNLLTGQLLWSAEIFNLFEIDKNQFAASYEAFLEAIHPEDRERVNLAYTHSLTTRQNYTVVHRLLMPDGRIKWVQERCVSDFDEEGKALVSRGTVQDITQQHIAETLLRESESRYHAIVAALSEGVVLNGQGGEIIEANEAAQEILGLSWAQMQGRTPLDKRWRAIHEDYTPFPGEEHPGAVTLRTGKALSRVVMGVYKPDGRLTWILINSQPVLKPGESLPSLVVVSFADITEHKQYEDQLKNSNVELEQRVETRTALLLAAKEDAEQANKSKSVFLTSMSHELRTPLNAILGYAQLMQIDSSLSEEVLENAREIQRAGEFLLSLMNDILDLARIESGKVVVKLQKIALSGVMENCYAQNMPGAISQNIKLHLADSCFAYEVVADERGLTQVLNNLISNAIKYNRAEGRVSVACSLTGSGRIRISVNDTGLGISRENQVRLFKPFERLGAEMGGIAGTGIGLTISLKLVESMRGELGVESVEGTGTTFWIELPAAGDGERAPSVDNTSTVDHVPYVLVAEDYVPNQTLLKMQLMSLGYKMEIAPDGESALAMWQDKQYDLILTDIDMPLMTGPDLAKAVRQSELNRTTRVPILAITANITKTERKNYLAAGIDELLEKPLSLEKLRNSLQKWLAVESTNERDQLKKKPQNEIKNIQAVFDPEFIYQMLGQRNHALACEMLFMFMSLASEGLNTLDTQTDNAIAVAREMHKQKSSAKTVGAMRYAALAERLEQQTKDEHYTGIGMSLLSLRRELEQFSAVTATFFDADDQSLPTQGSESSNEDQKDIKLVRVPLQLVLVVDDDLVVLQQVTAVLGKLGVKEVLTALNGVMAAKQLAVRGADIEIVICDLSMPEMDGVELIRTLGSTAFKGCLILISGADEKIISTVNRLAVLQNVRVLGQLQKPVNPAELERLLLLSVALPVLTRQRIVQPVVDRAAICAAIDADAFSIWLQPKFATHNLNVVGVEALARWQLPDGSFVEPDTFIVMAEREGLIGPLSHTLVKLLPSCMWLVSPSRWQSICRARG